VGERGRAIAVRGHRLVVDVVHWAAERC
jgi:hypothetical protein